MELVSVIILRSDFNSIHLLWEKNYDWIWFLKLQALHRQLANTETENQEATMKQKLKMISAKSSQGETQSQNLWTHTTN